MQYVLAVDQGTTSSRAVIFTREGSIVSLAQSEFKQHYPKPGWVEHDAEEIWSTQIKVVLDSLQKAGISDSEIAAVGITNQRETTVIWNRKSGKPVCPAIVWQDRRTAGICDEMKAQGLGDMIQRKTGLMIDSYFSATKIKWILDHIPGVRKQAESGELAFGTIDSWLTWNLTSGKCHITDVTNASRTMLYNIHQCNWDDEILDYFSIPRELLPEVRSSSEVYGHTDIHSIDTAIPIAGIAGDQQAALFGQMCLRPGMTKNTYGTGSFLMLNTGEKPIQSHNNLLTTIGWQVADQLHYALEGSIFIAGAVVQWLRDGLGLVKSSSEIESLATSEKDSGGIYLVPAFAGLGAPHWDQYARGIIVGLTRGTTAGHIARAALESIALQSLDVVRAMEEDSGIQMTELRVDGGATVNDTLMQFQSDILGVPLMRPKVSETTALGAAYLAGLAVGFWKDSEQISAQWQVEKRFEPQMDAARASEMIEGWHKAVDRSKGWA